MSVGCFTDKKHQPGGSEISEALGTRQAFWDELVRHLREHYQPDEDLKFLYGKNYGWALRFRVRGQVLVSLYPTLGGFTVQVNLSEAGVEKARQLAQGGGLPQAIQAATPYPEGRWLFVRIETGGDLRDVYSLFALRAEEIHLR
jgi:hypothetical protein